MTDNEIIKALNMATNIDGLQICCIDYENNPETKTFLSIKSDIVDLINRQQAEIKWWKDNCSKCGEKTTQTILYLQETLAEKDAEIERLTINMNAFGLGMKQEKERADTIKSEAIKEFAERLQEKADDIGIDEDGFLFTISAEWKTWFRVGDWCEEIIDNIVKEMVGK